MAKSIPAIVTPEVLVWARNLDAISIEEAAKKINVTPEKIEAWENSAAYPTMNQAKKLSNVYRVPFVYFYLPDKPKKNKRLSKTDYRTFGNGGNPNSPSRELRWFLRDIEERRDSVLSLFEVGKKPKVFPIKLSQNASDEEIAKAIRKLLKLTGTIQRKFRKSEVALKHCIDILEGHDVLIFQAAGILPSEMRGLSIAYESLPIIALNRKDEQSARLFTLCHELVHIVTRTSGICNDTTENPFAGNLLERRCNKIAGMILVPKDEIKVHPEIKKIEQFGFDDTYVNKIAKDFAVSNQVILYSLYDIGVIDRAFYFETQKRYSNEYLAWKKKKKAGVVMPFLNIGTQVGRLYARTILNAYHADRITARDTSGYLLNLKVKNLGKLESWCVR